MMAERPPRPGTPEWDEFWHILQDLGPGDHHYYSLYKGNDEIARFNQKQREWGDDLTELKRLCKFLNAQNQIEAGMIDNHLKLECLRLACSYSPGFTDEEIVGRAEAFAKFLAANQPADPSEAQRHYNEWANNRIATVAGPKVVL